MIFYRSEITPQRPLSFDETFEFRNVDYGRLYPILHIDSAKAEGRFFTLNKKLYGEAKVDCKLTLSDARSGKRIKRHLNFKESFCLLSDPLEEEDGYVFPENRIDLEEVVLCLIKTATPGFATDEKEMATKEKEEEAIPKSSPFDVLADYDFGDDSDGKKG